jgi:hypothetical protein
MVIVLLFSLLLITLFPPLPESPLLVEVLVQQEKIVETEEEVEEEKILENPQAPKKRGRRKIADEH